MTATLFNIFDLQRIGGQGQGITLAEVTQAINFTGRKGKIQRGPGGNARCWNDDAVVILQAGASEPPRTKTTKANPAPKVNEHPKSEPACNTTERASLASML